MTTHDSYTSDAAVRRHAVAARGFGAATPAERAYAIRDVVVLLASAAAVRLWFIFAFRIDSDEPQHLHVAWGWSRGLVQYRDVFDNHLPLLHLLYAPLLRVVPESSAVFILARLAILPVAMACAWLVYRVALEFVDRRAALIAAICFNAMPPWLPKSIEFRNDTLWIFFWLAGVALLVCRRAWAGAGFAFGLSLLASIKAAPLLLAHMVAFALARHTTSPSNLARLAAGGAIPVAVVIAAMASLGALDEMIGQTLLFNAAAPVSVVRRAGGALAFLVAMPLLARKAPAFARRRSPAAAHASLFAISYAAILLCFWPILTPRDYLPLAPLVALTIARRVSAWRGAAVTVFVAAMLMSISDARLWKPANRSRERFVDAVVGLTRPGDFVYDLKGESVFRRRPVHAIYEDVGRALTANGTIADRGPERIAASGCCTAVADSPHIPRRTRAFLQRYFVPVGLLRVCGAVARNGAFEIGVPQVYAIVSPRKMELRIDGRPYTGPLPLAPGRHTLTGPGAEGAVILGPVATKEEP